MFGDAQDGRIICNSVGGSSARPLAIAHPLPVAVWRVDHLRETEKQVVADVAEEHLERVRLERTHRRGLIERLEVKRVQRVEHRLAALEEFLFHRLLVQIEVSARRQPVAYGREEL